MSETNVPICDYEGSPWRTAFWRGRAYEDRAERIALQNLLPPRGKRILELGAGYGRLADLYRGYAQIILLDYSRSMLREAVALWGGDPRFVFVAADLYNLPFASNAFDTAVTVRVLHHVADIPRAFAEIARSVRPGGAYVAEFANKRHLKAILKHCFRRSNGVSPFTLAPYEFVKLNFNFHPSYIRQNLAGVNFQIRAARAVSTFRIGVLKRAVPAPLLAALDGLLQPPTANLQISPSLFFRAESCKPGLPELSPALWQCLNCHAPGIREQSDPSGLFCGNCGAVYPRVEGIFDFKGT